MTVWHVAAELGNLELLQNIWEWAKENIKTEDLNNKLLLATDNMERTVCHMAARGGGTWRYGRKYRSGLTRN